MMRPRCRHLWVLPVVWLAFSNFYCSGSNTPFESVSVAADIESDVRLSPKTRTESLSESPQEAAAEEAPPTVSAVEARRATARRKRERAIVERRSRRGTPAQDAPKTSEPTASVDSSGSAAETPAVDETVVATIGDYQILAKDFQDRMMQELAPDRYEMTVLPPTATPGEVVRMLLAEKAIAMEARKQIDIKPESYRI